MVTYSSYLPKKTDLTNSAFITGFANSGFELLAGIGVFAALGFMVAQQGVGINEVVSSGVGLAFVVFPQIINEFPALNGLFGSFFFICLTLAGLTSLISIVETFVAGVQDKFNVSRNKAVFVGGGLSAVISILFATQGGLYFLDHGRLLHQPIWRCLSRISAGSYCRLGVKRAEKSSEPCRCCF